MRRRRVPTGLIIPALLVGLVALLATLQYQWLGKVSEAEREQLRKTLTQRAREFADEFDTEISRTYLALQVSPDAVTSRNWESFAASVDRWRERSRFPRMIRGIYLAELINGNYALRRYEDARRSFSDLPLESWPANLEPVRKQIAGSLLRSQSVPPGKAQIIAITMTPVMAEVPALLVPVPNPLTSVLQAGESPRAALTTAAKFEARAMILVVDLDADCLRQTVIPALAATHFPEHGAENYRVAILSSSGEPLFERGVPPGSRLDPDRADVTTTFFTPRLEVARDFAARAATITVRAADKPATAAGHGEAATGGRYSLFVQERSADSSDSTARAGAGLAAGTFEAEVKAGLLPGQFRIIRSSWRVVLQHASGSLDAAVTQARRRNLALSFGILAILAVGIALVVLNARRSEELAARQMDFVASVTHELRTPLAVIRSAAQNLSAGVVSDPAQARRYGDLVEAEGRRLTDTIEQVLEYAGLAGNRRPRSARPLNVAGLVAEVVDALRPSIEAAHCVIEVDTPADGREVPAVMGDESALRRVLTNLLANAYKHGADGRWVGVEVGVGTSRGRTEVRITISDRGRGISPAELAHIFEPFFRGQHATDAQVHGNGIGLSLVQRIVEAHGGRVTVRSAPGAGTSFTVHLPAETAEAVREPLAGQPA